MSNISKNILNRFLDEISNNTEIEEQKVKLLKELLEQNKKPKPKDLESIFESVKEDV